MTVIPLTRLGTRDAGFQTAEAIGIAAVGIIVLLAVAAALESLGIEVVTWMRNSLVRG
jgi:hypothetical protein